MSFHILSESTCVEISSSFVVLLSWFSWLELLELSDPLRWAAFCCCLAMLFSFLPPLPRPIVDGWSWWVMCGSCSRCVLKTFQCFWSWSTVVCEEVWSVSWRFSKKFFKNFQSSEEMLSLRGVVNDLRAYSNLVCVVSAFLALFLAQVFPCLILIRIWPQFLCHPFLFPAWELFHVVNLALSGCYLLWALLNISEPMVCTVKIGFWIDLILYELSNANCDMDIIP